MRLPVSPTKAPSERRKTERELKAALTERQARGKEEARRRYL
jgi:hypothetical protein